MRLTYGSVAGSAACVLAGAALAVSLMHAGPAGPRGAAGPRGTAGQDAARARYGVCWSYATQASADGSVSWVTSVSIDPAQLASGVYQCPMGETFVSIVPAPASAAGTP
jgi:hypothetical protein